jgi:iron complex outermembrane receptor protein
MRKLGSAATPIVSLSLVLSLNSADVLTQTVAADTTTESPSEGLEEIVVTGTRQPGLRAADTAAPVQILSAEILARTASQPDLIQTLAAIVPSLTAQAFGFDASNATLQAKFRGSSPNHVLVLIDGKRRHPTANLAVQTGDFQGGAGADLNFIPSAAIARIEVLGEGAAAQYGSDAIAGVINIILKKDSAGGSLNASYGGYYDGGGITHDVSGNIGFEPWDGGYLNFTAEVRNHGSSDRSGIDPRLTNPARVYPDTNEQWVPGYPHLNRIYGDGRTQVRIASFNGGIRLGDDAELYAYGTYGDKNVRSYENYRPPSTISYTDPTGAVTYQYPYGFSPQEATHEIDYGLTSGVKSKIAGWSWDVSTTYGDDHINLATIHSGNQGLYAATGASPADFYDGRLKATQWTSNLDLNRDFEVGPAGRLNVAFGAEYRRDTYTIEAGSIASYILGGAESYSGFTPTDAGTHDRTNHAGYVDLAFKPIASLLVDAAGRFERYSDFRSKTVGKLTARYDFVPEFALRGTVSTGFRAPTVAEEYWRETFTAPSFTFVALAPNSAAAANLGLPGGLKPETSRNYSIGFVFRPLPKLTATLDIYQIDIRNRIVGSGAILGKLGGTIVDQNVLNSIAASGTEVLNVPDAGVYVFLNGADTRTRGADLAFDLPVDYKIGRIDWSLGAAYAETTLTNLAAGTPQLDGQPLFDATAISDLTTAAPRFSLNLGSLWTLGKLSVNLREQIFGPSNEWEADDADTNGNSLVYYNTRIGTTAITNLDLSYQATKHLKLEIGANNVFNRYPNQTNGTLLYYRRRAFDRGAVFIYPAFSPYGFDGGYYYIRARFQF